MSKLTGESDFAEPGLFDQKVTKLRIFLEPSTDLYFIPHSKQEHYSNAFVLVHDTCTLC